MKVKELQVIDSHFHFCDFPGFDQVALAAGYTNTEASLHQAFEENNVVHGVVMSNKTLDAKKHNYPDYMSYCIGIDSLTGKDDMENIAANVEENLKRSQCCGIKLYPATAIFMSMMNGMTRFMSWPKSMISRSHSHRADGDGQRPFEIQPSLDPR